MTHDSTDTCSDPPSDFGTGVPMSGVVVVPSPYMAGLENSVMLDGQLHVSDQFVAEARVASQERLKELMAGCKVIDLGKSADWISPKNWPVVFDPPAELFADICFRSYWR